MSAVPGQGKIVYEHVPYWISNPWIVLNLRIAKELISRGFIVEFVVSSRQTEKSFRQESFSTYNIWRTVRELARQINLKTLQPELEKEYQVLLDELCCHDVYYADSILMPDKPRNVHRLKVKTASYMLAWERYLKELSPQLVITSDVGNIAVLTCHYVAKKLGIPVICTPGSGVIPNTMFWDTSNMLNSWIRREYLGQEPTKQERERISAHIRTVKEKKPVIGGITREAFLPQNLGTYIKHLYYLAFIDKFRYEYGAVFPIVRRRVLCPIRERLGMKYYSEPDFDEKYVLFPLHVIYDAQVVLRGTQYFRQDKIAEMCAQNIPEGYALYVKEHPHGKGGIPLEWLRRISSLPNVKLISGEVNAHDLIKSSKCIITINSDVGWEALLYQKPVVVLAKPFYSGCGVTFDVDYPGELAEKVKEALVAKEIEAEKVYRLVNAVMKSLYNASFSKEGQMNCEPSNIKRIADSILMELSHIKDMGHAR